MVAGVESCFAFLAADRASAAAALLTFPRKTRVRGFRRHASGQTSRRGRFRSINTPGSRGCAYNTASGRHEWLYEDALKPIAELNAAGAVVSRFIYAGKANVPEYLVRGGTSYRLVTDHLGSVRLVVNAANGAIAQRMDYDEFGQVTLDTNPGFQPFGFAGGLYDSDTKLVRFGARDYDAETGRWLNQDPIGERGGLNLYAYVDNDPVNYVDPLGLWWGQDAFNSFGDWELNTWDSVRSGELQVSVGISGTYGVMREFTGLPNGFLTSANSIGFTTHGNLFFQNTSSLMNGFGIFGGGGLSLQIGYSRCPMKSGKSVSNGTHGEGDFGDVIEGALSFDVDDESAGMDVPLSKRLRAELGVGGGFISAAGPSTTTTYATPPLFQFGN